MTPLPAYRLTSLTFFMCLLIACGQNTQAVKEQKQINDPCDLETYLNDPKTPELAKKIFRKQNWNLNDFDVLNFLDSLDTNKPSRFFYFKVVTNSYSKADGYYSEGLGLFGKNFIEANTKKFTSYFDNKKCFTDQDLRDWAGITMLEIGLLADNDYTDTLLTGYIKKLERNCSNCSQIQKATLQKFIEHLKKEWTQFVKHAKEPYP